jgi:GAF domain-containing protein
LTSDRPRFLFFPGIDDDVRSAISADLAGDRLLGVLTVLHTEIGVFSKNHLVLMQAICQQVGLA